MQRNRFEKSLADKHACYLLITCDEPSDEGEMKIKMSHCGDKVLLSYLLQGAQEFIEEEISCEELD